MEEQHARIDRSLTEVTAQAPGWQRTADRTAAKELARALEEHRAALLEHLDDEERLVLPLVEHYLSVAEWDAAGRRGLETVPKDKLMPALGSLLEDADPQERAYFLDKAPLIGRLLWRAFGRRQYAAACRALRAPLHGGTQPLAFAQKAFNIRRDGRVALLFSDPTGSGLDSAPQIVVRGHAACSDEIMTGPQGAEDHWRMLFARQPHSRAWRARLRRSTATFPSCAQPRARSRLKAALISERWVNAWGKLPSCSPLRPISSA
ncbi:hypothetical protein ABZ128_05205 [Streptomyces sp. NPDC006326]|uniref:hypothetical protein n=1 Tax=Streptomyces sp. NPDC006326 TaxID=3156752 RepID=UPI0033BD9BD9